MRIQELFPDGEWKNAVEYLVKCPYCEDHPTHNHCYINVTKGRFYCHYCGEAGTMLKLEQDFGDGEKIDRESEELPTQTREKTDINHFPKVTGMSSTMDRMALTYLKERGMNKYEIELYDVRFSSYGRYYGRVLFPIYEDGKDVCFMGRGIIEKVNPKWMFPHKGETLLTTSECLFCYDFLNAFTEPKNVVLVEGAFDAIQLNRIFESDQHIFDAIAFGIMGKKLSDVQLNKLLQLPKTTQFYVMLDADAHKAEIAIAHKLRMYGREVRVCQIAKEVKEPDNIEFGCVLADVLENALEMDLNLEIRTLLNNE